MAAASQIFVYICQALEAETLQAQTALRAAASAKQLVQNAGINADEILASQTVELQRVAKAYFQRV